MKVPTALFGRLALLLPMAFSIFVLLDSQDRTLRLLALVALVILEQVREWVLISSLKSLRATGKDK